CPPSPPSPPCGARSAVTSTSVPPRSCASTPTSSTGSPPTV
ncbi:MAG: hypothetical protein AVDCRST_MAG38-2278, partial [uncultured Solirubrobacteraceae bacterium]